MKKFYMKKPVVIEAIQWDGENIKEIEEFCGDDASYIDNIMFIYTMEGRVTASVGDYIIKGIAGEFYPCKPEIFEATYYEDL